MSRALLSMRASVAAVALLACASSSCASMSSSIGIRAARARVDAFESAQAVEHPWPATSSMDDALAALKSDRIDAFPSAVRWLSTRDDVEALALRAQIELAWGDAELVVAEVRARAHDEDADEVPTNGAERHAHDDGDLDDALRMLGAEHVALGFRDAQRVIDRLPDDYIGHRVAADAYRMRGQWRFFDETLEKIEATHPESNGLVFLRGCRAWMHDANADEAARQFRLALARDPAFVRAQAGLVLVARDAATREEALAALARLSPDHQLVRYTAPRARPGAR